MARKKPPAAPNLKIYKAAALISDNAALDDLFAPVPNSAPVRAKLAERTHFRTWYYDKETRRDHWIATNGEVVVCVAIAGLGIEDAAKVRAAYEQVEDPVFGNMPLLAAVVTKATGYTVELVQ